MLGCAHAATTRLSRTISWYEKHHAERNGVSFPVYLSFYAAGHSEAGNWLPYWGETVRLNTKARNISVSIQNVQYTQSFTAIQSQAALQRLPELDLSFTQGTEQGRTVVMVNFLPATWQSGSGLQLVKSFDIVVTFDPDQASAQLMKKPFVSNSVLANGEWYKIPVTQSGFHRLDQSYFAAAGINLSGVDPRSIRIYGNGAGIMPQRNSDPRIDDLKENPIIVEGESDGTFNDQDYVLFYGKSQADNWTQAGTTLVREKNIYSDTTYYFLTFNQGPGKRIAKQASAPVPNSTEDTYQFCHAHESDLVNIGRSGRQFLGEAFDKTPEKTFVVNINGFIPGEPVQFTSAVAARSYISTPVFDVKINGVGVLTHNNMYTIGTRYGDPYYSPHGPVSTAITPGSSQLSVTYRFNMPPGGSTGWLDYFEVNAKARLTWYASQVLYRVLPTATPGNTAYTISNAPAGTRLFNVTDETDVQELFVAASGAQVTAVTNTSALSELAGISSATSFITPWKARKIKNQNLHALGQADVLYITPEQFYAEAMRLAAFHSARGLKVNVLNVSDIYNEFSGGAQDITGIRDLIRMFYTRATSPADRVKCVTLFGRSSYDYKNRIANNSNFVPTFQSNESFYPGSSYCSDDFFGFLDDNEGSWGLPGDTKELLDIGIGRLPISSPEEARNAVNKIIDYHRSDRMGNWRNKIVFVSDDEDSNIHQTDANILADHARTNFKNYNVQKIWIDAYREQVIAGGQRYPDAQKAISDAVQKGTFLVNYTGHGGELGWAEERILTIEDITSWTNMNHLPIFVTATCEFSRFDDPARVSAGELTFLSTKGGTIALFTTVRLVNASSNAELNEVFYRYAGLDSTSKISPLTLGEIMRLTKNGYGRLDRNERNFTLLGDAAMMLAYPKYNVTTTSINGKPMVDVTDTLKALAKVTVTGAVRDMSGNVLTTYNGEVMPTVYDKAAVYQTLVNNPKSYPSLQFRMQNNIIYSGSATVKDGLFTFSFIVPKDIAYQVDRGKISYYATDMQQDANGYNEQFVVGGTSDSAAADAVGPEIRLYMNDEKFVFGGMTDQNPLFIARLYDMNGINTIGRGIGRELSLTIDNDMSKATPVNDYYQARKDSYMEGEVRYQLNSLEAGKHTAALKAWDTYNNSSESSIDFVVATDERMALQHVLNYPNPFTTNTTFHFDHNKSGENLTVMIQVYTISGRLAKTLSTEVSAATSHFSDLKWDGLDDYGDKLGKGVYIYKVKVKSLTGKTAEATQKLVILN